MPLVVLRLPPLAQKYSSDPDGYDQSTFKGVFNVFSPIKTTHLLYIFLRYMMSFWWFILFFIDDFFIFRLISVICKKYPNTNAKDSKHTNAIDISIILSCGGAGSRVGGGVGRAGSFIAWIGSFNACIESISVTFFSII